MLARTAAEPLLVFAFALLVTGALVASLAIAIQRRDRLDFEYQVAQTAEAINQRIAVASNLLRGAVGLFEASDAVTAAEFHHYVANLDLRRRYQGILGIGYSQRLAPDEVAAFERRVRASGRPGFHVWPVSRRAEYNAILYLEPLDRRNAAAIGYDMATNPVRRAAMEAARARGDIVASGRVTLVQEIDRHKQAGFLLYLPLYANADAGGRRSLRGFVYAPLRAGDLLAGTRGQGPRRVDYQVFDGLRADPAALLRSTFDGPAPDARFVADRVLEVGGRHWLVRFYSRPELDALSRGWLVPWLALAALAASTLLALLSRSQARARRAAEAVAKAQRRAAEALRESDRRKDEFLAMLAHELRNPLAPINTAATLLRLPQASPALVEEASGIIARQVGHMAELVDELLDVSRVNRGLVALEEQVFDLRTALHAAVEQTRPQLRERRHAFAERIGDAPLWVRGDCTRLTQVVANLLDNAAKYTPPGGEVALEAVREDGRIEVRVRDNGVGIEPALRSHVFDLFAQAARPLDRAQGGLGIGLALVRKLVELHGGRVRVDSPGAGGGSVFTVVLPAAAAPARVEAAPPPRPPGAPLRVTIVDDNPDALRTMAFLLQAHGHAVATHADAESALAAIEGVPADVYLLDIGLPGMDGHALARRLRADPRTARATLVALSGYGQPADLDASFAAGFDAHLVKPVDAERLLGVLRDLGLARGTATAG
ncbi:MAG: CHASE domain-containing protein [Lysobacteraceae bacterium]